MAHGAPDFSKYRRDSTTYSLQDLAELAVRLGSIITFDRRGDVVFTETFNHGYSMWTPQSDGANSAFGLNTTYFLSAGVSLGLTPGSDDERYALVYNHLPYPGDLNMGGEIHFTLAAEVDNFRLGLRIYDGTTLHRARITYDPGDQALYYEDANEQNQSIATGLNLNVNPNHFHALKFVIDLATQSYTRVILNDTEYTLEDPTYYTTASALDAVLQIVPNAVATSGNNPTIYVDNAIITQDEP